jgi:hypothetical protein
MDRNTLLQYYTGLLDYLPCTAAVKIEHGPEYAIAILGWFSHSFAVNHSGKN